MIEDALLMTTYFGERDAAGRGSLADAILDVFDRHRLEISVLLRGIEGFGAKHRLETERLLSLSDDLPLVAVAVDRAERIENALLEIAELTRRTAHGLVTLQPAWMLGGDLRCMTLPQSPDAGTKLTVYLGRHERAGRVPAFRAVVDLMRAHHCAGATALLGVDGTRRGVRHRARFVARNAQVPMMVTSVGSGAAIPHLLHELGEVLEHPLVTVQPVRVCKRDGERFDGPPLQEVGASGRSVWARLTVYASEQDKYDGHSLYVQLVRRLRESGASGATALRGIWGYHGEHAPHGDRATSLARHVPVVCVIVDSPRAIRRSFDVIDLLTRGTGLVTSEMVSAFRALGAHGSATEVRSAAHRPAPATGEPA